MKTFRILIAEHDIPTAQKIKQQLQRWGYHVLPIVTSRQEAEELYRREEPDLSLVNLNLKDYGEGVGFANFIRRRGPKHPIIYLVEGLGRCQIELIKPTLPAGFLFKPVQPELLRANVEIALHRYAWSKPEEPVIMLTAGEEYHRLPVSNILYLEADHVYVQVYTASGEKILQRSSLSDLLAQLPTGQFVQTHRSFAVNIEQLNRWNKQYVYVQGRAVPLSRARRKVVLAMVNSVVARA